MARLIFMLEEESMVRCLKGLLPRLLPGSLEGRDYLFISHDGKQHLEKSLPRKLRSWNYPDDLFVILRDQDSGDCKTIKQHLVNLCEQSGRQASLIRIVCRELESWYIGDLAAVAAAFHKPKLVKNQSKAKFSEPDKLGSPATELKKLVPNYMKKSGSSLIGQELSLEPNANMSRSFQAFISGIRRIAQG
ncbi:MAG: DUF4276 family protein [Pseudodesulfovibrio sp.]|uniref:Cytoplasmic protein n=1 Tax=Pseudodesulfovibrio aespoeensis (strain ATCC 700646 / DSM 10631 / Aspo-2) TaxID=643562 RepID=E6VR60_PSEA9|nr:MULTISPECIES: DUF4276 family protein [Pseudodesulfovibrio]MBU4191552.1 DUF4276 family protein [Pseudomonadota bacterium]ADU64144.1 hypothetical protein Daes_3152 [Pseudodesulfovibrio aespoeensis Aspo-2]MBU4243546.1 DUF4276 family protein [Pseudomonadota bacterium]MBU4378788.1 DUF4276 family protein [Pseudomonadota bacterium]MBU4475464.1 DUF4276 family protein [Pseudomonadota bacterium]